MFSWILIRGFASFSRYAYSFAYLEYIAAFSEEFVAKLVYGVFLLYLIVIGSCIDESEKRAARYRLY